MTNKSKKEGGQVNFQLAAAAGSKVYVAGTFNNWKPRQHPLRIAPHSGVFSAALTLSPGRHEYKYIVNGEWLIDEAKPNWTPNELGSLNSVMNVDVTGSQPTKQGVP